MKDRENTPIPPKWIIKRLPAKRCAGSDTWRLKGGMMGGNAGSCRAVTSGNGIGVVPQAFNR